MAAHDWSLNTWAIFKCESELCETPTPQDNNVKDKEMGWLLVTVRGRHGSSPGRPGPGSILEWCQPGRLSVRGTVSAPSSCGGLRQESGSSVPALRCSVSAAPGSESPVALPQTRGGPPAGLGLRVCPALKENAERAGAWESAEGRRPACVSCSLSEC